MQFRESQPIFLQIADYVCEKILLEEWKAEDKIPSVRDLAVQLEVNPNTVMRTYEWLKQMDVIYDKRGVGSFISEGAPEQVRVLKKQAFFDKDLPLFFHNLCLLGLTPGDLKAQFEQYKKKYFK